tara:strand:+ start:501 stop:3209 length:2709 start_codon:yes stop_codon:yes gene_type:complete
MATDDELTATDDELLAMMKEQESSGDDALLSMMANQGFIKPGASEVEGEGEWYSGPVHALKGYGKMATGAADMPNLISKVMTYPPRKILNAMGVDEEYTDKAIVPTLSGQEFMQPVNEYFDKTEGVEEDSGWDSGQTFVEWAGMGPISAARKGARVAPDILMGIGATLGDYLDGSTPWGEVLGGMTGLAASLRRGTGIDRALATIQDNITTSADDVANTVRAGIASDEVGTLADLARDQGIMDVEQLTSGGNNTEKYRAIELARQRQIADEVRAPFGTADPNLAAQAGEERIGRIIEDVIPKHVGTRQEQVEIPLRAEQKAARVANEIPQAAAVEAGLNKATAELSSAEATGNAVEAARAAEAAQAAFSTGETLAESSIMASVAWKAEKAADKADNVQPIWDDFDAIESTPYAPYRNTVNDFVDGLPESQKVEILANPKIDSLLRPFKNKDITKMKPKQIQKYLEQIKNEIDNPVGGRSSAAHGDLRELYTELRNQLGDEIPKYNEAMTAEAAWKTRFDAGGVVDEAASGAPELFFKGVGESDEAGAVAARILKNADIPGMPEAQAGRLRALARRFKGGIPDEQFLLEYESIMDSLPTGVRNQAQQVVNTGRGLEAAVAAQTAADDVTKVAGKQALSAQTNAAASTKATTGEVARLENAIDAQKGEAAARGTRLEQSVAKSILNKYVKDRKGTLLRILKNPDDVSDLVELQRSMEKLGEVDSFNANLGDVILEHLSVKGRSAGLREATGSGPKLTTAAIPEFNKIAASLVEAGSDPKTMQAIREKLYRLQTVEQRSKSRKAILESDSLLKDVIVSGSKVAALKVLPGNSLVMAGTVGRVMRALLTRLGSNNKAVLATIDDFMLNPEKYLKALENAKTPARAQQLLMSKLVASANASKLNEEE